MDLDLARGPVYDPYAYEIHEDPYPTYARLRRDAPVYRNEAVGFWALSRHADVIDAFRDHVRFSSRHGVSLDPAVSGPDAARSMSFLGMDPPEHGRMRGLVARVFTPRRVAELEPRIRELARGYVDRALAGDGFDFVGALAGRLPMDVISELVGVPGPDRAEIRRLSDLLVHREEGIDDVPPAGIEAALHLAAYYQDMLAERRRRRTDDLTSALLDAELDGDRLTDDEIIGFLFLLVVAGNETTTKLLANAWYWGWRVPDQRAKAFADPGRVPDWVEETLRYDTSTQLLARVTTEAVTLHDVTIPAGERVVLLVGSANRDERVFARPDEYDLDRPEAELRQIASFGSGRHFCMGAWLARLETTVCLDELVTRVADYEIDPAGCARVHSINVRGFATLPTTVVAR
jgi:cytochrome P450